MSRIILLSAFPVAGAVACVVLTLAMAGSAKETDSFGKNVDTNSEIVFESQSEAAAENPEAQEPIDFDSKRPSILGMTVVENADGMPVVVDVGATSPAWNAGIRENDIVVSLHGLNVKSFEGWAENVRKVVTDAKAGQTIPVRVVRDGTSIDMRVEISELKNIAPLRQVRNRQNRGVLNPALANQQPMQYGGVPSPIGAGGYGGVGIIGDGVANGGRAGDQLPTRATAQLVAVNVRTGPNRTPGTVPTPTSVTDPRNVPGGSRRLGDAAAPGLGTNQPVNSTDPTAQSGLQRGGDDASGQVGVAEFVDDAGGMVAMVALGGLPAGSYRVGIGDYGGGIEPNGFASPAAAADTNSLNAGRLPQSRSQRRINPRRGQNPDEGEFPSRTPTVPYTDPAPIGQPAPATPGAEATPGAGGSGNAVGNDGRLTGTANGSASKGSRTKLPVLAQVAPDTPSFEQRSQNQATQTVDRNHRGSASQLEPTRTRPAAATATGTSGLFGIELGVVDVQPGGVGRLQQLIEGIRVASVIGQSVIVVPNDVPVTNGAAQASSSFGVVAAGVIQIGGSGQPSDTGPVTSQKSSSAGAAQGTAVTQPPTTTGSAGTQPIPSPIPAAASELTR